MQHSEKILKEAARMGFERIVLPIKNAERLKKPLAEINSARRAKGETPLNLVGLKNIAGMQKLL